MFGIGMPEMILILALALIVIGPKKLPDLAKSLGRALGEFRKATSDLKRSMEIEEISEVKSAFNDLNKDINQSLKGDSQPTDTSSTTTAAQTDPESKTQSDSDEPLSNLKKAFDDLNQDAEPAPDQTNAADTHSDEPTDNPDEPSLNDETEGDHKGSMTNERG